MNALDQFTSICKSVPLVAILRGIKPEETLSIGRALINAGIRLIEVPLNSPEPLDSIRRICKEYGNEALCGAGTVTNLKLLQAALDTGAKLIVSPNINTEVIQKSVDAGAITIPGCITATEMFNAIDAGAQVLKFFPAIEQSEKALAAIKSVLPAEINIFPVGGINLENMECFIKAGANGFGIGSNLFKPGINANEVESKAMAYVQRIKEVLGQ